MSTDKDEKKNTDKDEFMEVARNTPTDALEKLYDRLQTLADLVVGISGKPDNKKDAANDQQLELQPLEETTEEKPKAKPKK